eukprot:scpid31336/ scgid11423/ 
MMVMMMMFGDARLVFPIAQLSTSVVTFELLQELGLVWRIQVSSIFLYKGSIFIIFPVFSFFFDCSCNAVAALCHPYIRYAPLFFVCSSALFWSVSCLCSVVPVVPVNPTSISFLYFTVCHNHTSYLTCAVCRCVCFSLVLAAADCFLFWFT